MTKKKKKDKKKGRQVDLFLDSGAYSAFTQGIDVDIQEYITFIKDNIEHLEVYANLDVIGDAVGTLKNQKIMEDAGLSPLPCFHYGEPFSYLQDYVDGYDYIALGVSGVKDKQQLSRWMDHCWTIICGDDGMPKCKVHGFAVTSVGLMSRYPWYSVDSTSWVMTSRFGKAFIPRLVDGEWCYRRPLKLSVSAQSPDIKKKGAHMDTVSKTVKRHALEYFKSHGFVMGESTFKMVKETKELKDNEKWVGKANEDGKRLRETIVVPGLCNEYRHRDRINIIFFMELEKQMPEWPWSWKLPKRTPRMGL